MNNDVSINEILTPTAHLILSLGEIASFIENKYAKCIIAYPVGIYKIGQKYPSVISGYEYYVKRLDDANSQTPLTDFDSLDENNYIVDKKGRVVIESFYLKNKNTALSSQPTICSHGFEIAKAAIQHHVGSKNTYTRESSSAINQIGKYLTNYSDRLEVIDDIINDQALSSLYHQIDMFVGRDVFHVYFYKSLGLHDLMIEKTIDWRAYQWHLTQQLNSNEHNHS